MSNTNQQYRVGPKAGVTIGARYYGPKTLIPAGAMNERQLKNLLEANAIHLDGSAPRPSAPAVTPPGVGVSEREFWDKNKDKDASVGEPTSGNAAARAQAALKQLRVDREEGRIAPREAATSVEIVREETAPAAPAAPVSPWTHDPDGLVGLPIDELRALITAVDATIEVASLDEVECIAILSSDYVAPTAPAQS